MKKKLLVTTALLLACICCALGLAACNNHEHIYGDWSVTKQPTCKEEGENSRTCSICGDIQTEAISKINQHTYDATNTCTVCGYALQYTIGLQYEEVTDDKHGAYYIVTGIGSASGDIVIPAYYKGKIVLKIGNFAFAGCTKLTSVTIPDSITSIGGSAFYGCSSLTSVTIPDSVTSIEGGAFYGCSSLTSVTIPDNVTYIGSSVFAGCESLTNVVFKNTMGWTADNTSIASEELSDPATAATYLTSTYCDYIWHRS